MTVVLGIVPVIVAWLYSEYLHYAKHSVSAKTRSNVNLVEIAKDFVKEDDKALLIEDGGGLQSASPRAKGPIHTFSSHQIPLVLLKQPVTFAVFVLMLICRVLRRFVLLDESFLLENRLTLRAIIGDFDVAGAFMICSGGLYDGLVIVMAVAVSFSS